MKSRSRILKYLLIVFFIVIALNFLMFLLVEEDRSDVSNSAEPAEEISFFRNEDGTLVSMKLPAVDEEGNGAATTLSVEAVKGSGKTLVEIENLLFWADTQQSIRMSRLVAGNYSKNNIKDYDLIYSVTADATLIGGPSAGAAITIATIFALNGEKPREDVMITGAINHDGSIGPVSSILEKAKASKETGATIFLVPLLQSGDIVYETAQYCEKFGYTEICQTESIPKKINVGEETGIQVVEVANIEEALKYFKS